MSVTELYDTLGWDGAPILVCGQCVCACVCVCMCVAVHVMCGCVSVCACPYAEGRRSMHALGVYIVVALRGSYECTGALGKKWYEAYG